MSPLGMHRILEESSADDLTLHYDLGDVLGFGSFSTVYRCTHRGSGEEFACKVIEKSKLTTAADLEDLRNEVGAMRTMQGQDNVVQLLGVYEDAERVQLVLELCEGGDLFSLLEQRGGGLPESEAADIFRQIMEAVAACHSKGIMHRDLKLENVLLTRQQPTTKPQKEEEPSSPTSVLLGEGPEIFPPSAEAGARRVKLADFGLAVQLRGGEQTRGLAGSAFYMAPEIASGQSYGLKSDMWSCGVVLYALLTGELPFAGSTHQEVHRSVVRRGRLLTVGKKWWPVSPSAKGLVQRLLEYAPSQRPGAREVLLLDWVRGGAEAVSSQQFLLAGQSMRFVQAAMATELPGVAARGARDSAMSTEEKDEESSSCSTSSKYSDSPMEDAATPESPADNLEGVNSRGRRRGKGEGVAPVSLWKAIFSSHQHSTGALHEGAGAKAALAGGRVWRIGHRHRVMCSSNAVPVA